MKTPHIDELASTGVQFTNWYSNSPVCSPSRASLLTGRYPARTGITAIIGAKRGTPGILGEELTLASALRQVGYKTALFGKWHLGGTPESSPNAQGFDEFFGFKSGCLDYYSHLYYFSQHRGINPAHDLWHNEREVWHNGSYLTEMFTARTVDFIETHKEQPFFVTVTYNAPHYPMHAPKEYVDRFPDLPPDKRIMAAMIAAVDDGVGEIVDALKRNGLYENTAIFFSSDNGPSSESRNYLDGTEDLYYGGSAGIFRGHKASLFEGGIREPAILTYPALLPGGIVSDQMGAMMDVFPTFVELAAGEHGENDRLDVKSNGGMRQQMRTEPDGQLDGHSILPVLLGRTKRHREVLYWEYEQQLAIRCGKWKLVKNGKLDFDRAAPDPLHLSDLELDPGERVNLCRQFPDVAAELTKTLETWAAQFQ
jgi:arylsulfatase A-like enzyme